MREARSAQPKVNASITLRLLALAMVIACDSGKDTSNQTPRQGSATPVSFTGPTALLPVPELSTDLIRTTNIRKANFPTLGGVSVVVTEVIP